MNLSSDEAIPFVDICDCFAPSKGPARRARNDTRNLGYAALACLCLFITGCRTAPAKDAGVPEESTQEVLGAVGSMTGALTGKEISDEQARKVVRDMHNDKEAQSAIQSISGAMVVTQTGIKYCPVDGKRYSADLEECPQHKVKLKELVE